MLDTHTQEHGYEEVYVPYLVNADSMRGTGQLPKFEEDLFKLSNGMYPDSHRRSAGHQHRARRDHPGENLPIKLVAHTPCFRSEAGSYGRDTRGMIRQHQFDKVEMVQFVRPEDSYDALEELTGHAEAILQKLDLPYRVMALVHRRHRLFFGQDLRPGSLAAGAEHLSRNFLLLQLRGLPGAPHAGALPRRQRGQSRKPELIHTLNGSGLAVGPHAGRHSGELPEPDGSVTIPEVLRPYMGGMTQLVKE
jgi:seryl-tRNA synthetase